MAARTNATPPATATTAGVLRPDEFARHVELERTPAGEHVSRWVENHWHLRWDLPDGRHFPSQVLAHPTVSLTVERGSHRRPQVAGLGPVVVTGVSTKRFDVDVRGWGDVHGVRFRPGGLAALTASSAAAWTDRSLAAAEVLPARVCEVLTDPDLLADAHGWRLAAERALAALAPASDPDYDAIVEVVADMLADHSLVTVADVAARHGLSVRTLQRRFVHFVGVSPKWVLARYRIHDAVAEIDSGYCGTLTDLAQRFGWYDQSHFRRDFAAVVGVSPTEYVTART